MFSTRNFIAPIARASFRPRVIQAYPNAQIASLRARIAAISTVSDPIIHDHKELNQFYNEVINNPTDHDHQDRYGNQFTWELARHSIAEELVVYPAFEKYLGEEGKRMAEGDRKQHHAVRLEPVRNPNDEADSRRSKSRSRSFKTCRLRIRNMFPSSRSFTPR